MHLPRTLYNIHIVAPPPSREDWPAVTSSVMSSGREQPAPTTVCERQRECVCVCVCERERERGVQKDRWGVVRNRQVQEATAAVDIRERE